MIYVAVAITVLLSIASLVACFVPPLPPPANPAPPPAPARGDVTWQMTFFHVWPISEEITLRQEFPAGLELREVNALWMLEMAGWSSIAGPSRVPPEDVK